MITDYVSKLGVVILLTECIRVVLKVVVVVSVSLVFEDIFELFAFLLGVWEEVTSSLSKLVFPVSDDMSS